MSNENNYVMPPKKEKSEYVTPPKKSKDLKEKNTDKETNELRNQLSNQGKKFLAGLEKKKK